MHPTLFLTGPTGMLGRDLVPYLLAHSDVDLVLLCHRRGAELDAASYLASVHGLPSTNRVRIVRGDVRRPGLGLDAEERKLVERSVTHILHAAASTRFDQELEDARSINVAGTRQVAEFARRCRRLAQFGYVSTAFVSGRRTGIIREDELRHNAGFVNSYEQSKYEAESYLASCASDLPIAVYRLSTIFGDSRTGAVRTMTAPHLAMKIIYHGLAVMLPGLPDCRVDFIPGDYAASALGRLFVDRFEAGKTCHVTANPERSYVLSDLVDAVYGEFAALDPEWRRRRYPKPLLSSPEAFRLFTETAEKAGDPILVGVLRSIRHFADQLTCPKAFDRSNVVRALPGYDADFPDIREYADKVVRFCVETRWGKRAA